MTSERLKGDNPSVQAADRPNQPTRAQRQPHEELLVLQRLVGNKATAQALARPDRPACSPPSVRPGVGSASGDSRAETARIEAGSVDVPTSAVSSSLTVQRAFGDIFGFVGRIVGGGWRVTVEMINALLRLYRGDHRAVAQALVAGPVAVPPAQTPGDPTASTVPPSGPPVPPPATSAKKKRKKKSVPVSSPPTSLTVTKHPGPIDTSDADGWTTVPPKRNPNSNGPLLLSPPEQAWKKIRADFESYCQAAIGKLTANKTQYGDHTVNQSAVADLLPKLTNEKNKWYQLRVDLDSTVRVFIEAQKNQLTDNLDIVQVCIAKDMTHDDDRRRGTFWVYRRIGRGAFEHVSGQRHGNDNS